MNLREFLFRKRTIAGAFLGVVVGWAAVVAFNSYTFNPKRWVKLRARKVAKAYIAQRSPVRVGSGEISPHSVWDEIDDAYIPWYLDDKCYQPVSVGHADISHKESNPNNWSAVAYLSVVRHQDGFSQNVDEIRIDIEVMPDGTVSEKVVGSFLGDKWSFNTYEERADRTPIQVSPFYRLRQYVISFLP